MAIERNESRDESGRGRTSRPRHPIRQTLYLDERHRDLLEAELWRRRRLLRQRTDYSALVREAIESTFG